MTAREKGARGLPSLAETSAGTELPPHVSGALDRLGELIQRFEQHPDAAVQQRAIEMLQCLDVVHRAGLRRIAGLLELGGLQRHAVADPTIQLLFDLYELSDGGERARAQAVLDEVAPALREVGAEAELVESTPDAVTVRLAVAPGLEVDAPALADTLTEALSLGLPDVERIEVQQQKAGPVPGVRPPTGAGFVPLDALLGAAARPELRWTPVFGLDALPVGELRAVQAGGLSLLLARVAPDEVYAYRNLCPGSPLPLHLGRVEGTLLHCPWHGCRFELRGGRRVEGHGPGLGVVPVRLAEDQVLLGQQGEPGT